MNRGTPLLLAEQITKTFDNVAALTRVGFDLYAGEIHALCGENGAGKSTLIKILSGIYPHASFQGRFLLDGQEARFRGVRDAERAGVSVIYQELALVPEMTIAENIFLGNEPVNYGCIDSYRMARESALLLDQFGLCATPDAHVGRLGVAQQQLVEIIKAIRKRTRILILDEPTAALGAQEVRHLLSLMRRLASDGVACIYISHRLDEVLSVADRITVLRDGISVWTKRTVDTCGADVISAMAGRQISDIYVRSPPRAFGETLMDVSELTVLAPDNHRPILTGISFQVRSGEVLGIAGLMGAGRSDLLLHLYDGRGIRHRGKVRVVGQEYEFPNPKESLRRGLAMVTEDRRRLGLIPEQSVSFNLSLSILPQLTTLGLLRTDFEATKNRSMIDQLNIKNSGANQWIRTLSGGNQQKVILGRSLLTIPRIVFLDEPTRGIDIRTKHEIYELINDLTHKSRAIVLVSSDLTELLGMSDRVLVMRAGRIVAEVTRQHFNQKHILAAALGHSDESQI